MVWRIRESPVYRRWWETLEPAQQDELAGRLELLREHGPTLGRPVVDRVAGSSIHNLKELRAQHKASQLRVLFVFDPDRQAVLLVGGDKAGGDASSGRWAGWYEQAIPVAERIYQAWLGQRGKEDDDG